MKQLVLLVEDNEDNRAIYRTMLEFAGYGVAETLDGLDAIRQARENLPALLLMDIAIPIVDGLEATRIRKGDPATAGIPIVALTAHALAGDRARSEEAGCNGYFAKPNEARRVVEEVDRFLGLVRPVRGPEVRIRTDSGCTREREISLGPGSRVPSPLLAAQSAVTVPAR